MCGGVYMYILLYLFSLSLSLSLYIYIYIYIYIQTGRKMWRVSSNYFNIPNSVEYQMIKTNIIKYFKLSNSTTFKFCKQELIYNTSATKNISEYI